MADPREWPALEDLAARCWRLQDPAHRHKLYANPETGAVASIIAIPAIVLITKERDGNHPAV